CDDGFYGENCNKKCSERNCINNSTVCSKVDGSCNGECLDGYSGIDCSQTMPVVPDQKCGDDFYGINCNKKCSERNCINNSTVCSKVDGSCNGECLDGYSGIDCSRSSSASNPNNGKQFGYLELFTCHCTNDNDCNTDGSCQSNGCATGWYGSTCQK
ncbi:hypothetical protein LOTGIDRAFT_176902, partial [Lottia gigantea]